MTKKEMTKIRKLLLALTQLEADSLAMLEYLDQVRKILREDVENST